MMVEGDQWEMWVEKNGSASPVPLPLSKGALTCCRGIVLPDRYVPSELAYGDRGSPPKIGSGDVLIFVMELVKIKGATVPAEPRELDTGGDAGIAAESTDLAGGRHQVCCVQQSFRRFTRVIR